MDNAHHITVIFDGDGFRKDERGPLLLAMEAWLRHFTGKPAEVFMQRMGDDSKLRRSMTSEERAKL